MFDNTLQTLISKIAYKVLPFCLEECTERNTRFHNIDHIKKCLYYEFDGKMQQASTCACIHPTGLRPLHHTVLV